MSIPIRLSDELLMQAEKQVKLSFRSVPKQIEFWAQIGKEVESNMTPADVAALVNGEIEIKMLRKNSIPIEFNKVFDEISEDRDKGIIQAKVVKDEVWYEESKEHPGLLVRVCNGKREVGTFKEGKFKVETSIPSITK